ncbi:AcvB/VirJ family lysyl-phosphatidylglycerol hydrolase [Xanthomonas arboricola]|nr:AcvB/VirJ family lysyl-phosphatidylglycerol hydrolase [Xanthomonas arboricola]
MLSGDPVAGRASPAMHLRRLGKDTLCPESRARGVQVVTRPGGHHFDHDPVALAGLLIQGWQQAAQTPSHG